MRMMLICRNKDEKDWHLMTKMSILKEVMNKKIVTKIWQRIRKPRLVMFKPIIAYQILKRVKHKSRKKYLAKARKQNSRRKKMRLKTPIILTVVRKIKVLTTRSRKTNQRKEIVKKTTPLHIAPKNKSKVLQLKTRVHKRSETNRTQTRSHIPFWEQLQTSINWTNLLQTPMKTKI